MSTLKQEFLINIKLDNNNNNNNNNNIFIMNLLKMFTEGFLKGT